MIFCGMKKLLLAGCLSSCFLAAVTTGQPGSDNATEVPVDGGGEMLEYLDTPAVLWSARTTDDATLGVKQGNGLFMSPDGSMLVSTSADGTLRAFQPSSGKILWTYKPPSLGVIFRCFGGLHFNDQALTPYMVYAITDGISDPLTTTGAQTRVIAVDMDGNELFQTSPLQGVAAGPPVTDYEGQHILVTHNEDRLRGYLSIFLVTDAQPDTPLDPVFSEGYTATNTNDTSANATNERPFSPIGYFYNPIRGWYDGGQGNTNDIFVFAWDTPSTATAIASGDGQVFYVQFPMDYLNDGKNLSFSPLSDTVDFHAMTAPVITNEGRSMYWSVSKAAEDCYIGQDNLDRTLWNRGKTKRVTLNRATKPFPPYQSGRASPTLSDGGPTPTVYGPGAASEIFRMNYDFSTSTTVPTVDIVSSHLLVTPDKKNVIYATQTTNSNSTTKAGLFMVDAETLAKQVWTLPVSGGIAGHIALSADGSTVFAANPSGSISAYQFAKNNSPVAAPTPAPSLEAGMSDAPSMVPTGGSGTPAPTTEGGTGEVEVTKVPSENATEPVNEVETPAPTTASEPTKAPKPTKAPEKTTKPPKTTAPTKPEEEPEEKPTKAPVSKPKPGSGAATAVRMVTTTLCVAVALGLCLG